MPMSAHSHRLPDPAPLVALIEDDPVMGQSVADWLGVRGYRLAWLRTGAEATARIPALRPDVVICDIRLPDMTGEDVHAALGKDLSGIPILFVTGYGEIEQAVRLMKAGAADYVTKPFDIEVLLDRIETLLAPRWQQTDGFELGASPAIVQVERILRRIAAIDSTVLLSGPSGSGKEVAARFLHRYGPRAERPFVVVNCAAIPRDLLESELFGHERGAFTGAHVRHTGHVERAGDGTLFLDEVAELPTPMQAKLLRLMQERVFTRVGGEQPLRSAARVIAATNADLGDRVRRGEFRDDLFHRLNVIAIAIPSLAARRDDILPLALRFIGEFSGRFEREVLGLTAFAQESLLAHDFPGNIRELRNRIERAVALAEGPWIGVSDLFPERANLGAEQGAPLTLAAAREDAERRLIARVLGETNGDVDSAADRLDVSRSTLFDKIRRLGIRT
jgi:DNA-binding NtrC family response regulator